MIDEIFLLILGLILLIKGADYFISSAAKIAHMLGVSEIVVGLTLVAFGTSLPELASAVSASVNNAEGLVIGNIIGSNITNICLIIGIGALFSKIKIKKQTVYLDIYMMIFVSFLFSLLFLLGPIGIIKGILMVILYFSYVFFLFREKDKNEKKDFRSFLNYFFKFRYVNQLLSKIPKRDKEKTNKTIRKSKDTKYLIIFGNFLVVIVSGFAIVFGAKYLIQESIYFARIFKIPEAIIGVTLLALGTSLPELSVTINAIKKGFGNLAIGNVVGSNIANILFIGGIASIINPLVISQRMIYMGVPGMIFASLLLLFFAKTKRKVSFFEGVILILSYFLILGFMVFFKGF